MEVLLTLHTLPLFRVLPNPLAFWFELGFLTFLWVFGSGVYSVSIDAEQQKVTVTGNVDAATLINKLVRRGKHAELWPPNNHQNQNQQHSNFMKDDDHSIHPMHYRINDNQHMLPSFYATEDQDRWARGMYLNQSMGSKAMAGYTDHNMATPTMEGYAYMGGDADNTLMGLENFQVNAAGFVGLGGYGWSEFQDFSAGFPSNE